MDDISAAKVLIGMLDLTSLNNDDAAPKIEKFCKKATTPYGNVAAVCVYPEFVPVVKESLNDTGVKAATVVNFPKGEGSVESVRKEIKNAIELGADEIDAVFPYKKFMSGDKEFCADFLKMVVEECGKNITTKIILETGELKTTKLIKEASKMCIDADVNFIKTSTGKTKISATPEAANAILETIKESKKRVGFKASGGIKDTYDAKKYLILTEAILGNNWLSPNTLRIGASSLLDDLIDTIEKGY